MLQSEWPPDLGLTFSLATIISPKVASVLLIIRAPVLVTIPELHDIVIHSSCANAQHIRKLARDTDRRRRLLNTAGIADFIFIRVVHLDVETVRVD